MSCGEFGHPHKTSAMISPKRKNMLRILATFIVAFLVFLSQTVRAQGIVLPLPAEDQAVISAQLGPGIVGEALPSVPVGDVSSLFPLQERASVYQVTAGPNAGNTERLNLAKLRRPSGKPAWRFQLSPSLAAFIHQTPQGDLMMPAVGDAGEGVVVITTPANPFVIKNLKPGESRTYEQQVVVNALDDPADQEYSGSLLGTYTYVGTYQVTVPAGTYGALLFRLRCEGKVGPADTHDTAYYFFAPGKGVVAMISQEDATAFWLIHIDTTTGKVLMAN
jgi:hypothetical protein